MPFLVVPGYLAHGTGTDYMHDVMGVPLSFTWEIYGDEQASFQECFKMFNPLTKSQLDQVANCCAIHAPCPAT